MTKLIINQDCFGEIVRIGLYNNGKWVKWIKKSELDKYIDMVDVVENKNV
jgi:hypothetical protein